MGNQRMELGPGMPGRSQFACQRASRHFSHAVPREVTTRGYVFSSHIFYVPIPPHQCKVRDALPSEEAPAPTHTDGSEPLALICICHAHTLVASMPVSHPQTIVLLTSPKT